MTPRRILRNALLTAVALATITPFTFAPAVAEDSFVAPEVTFAGTAPGTVTATLHNPNDRGQCWAEAGVGPELNHVFFGEAKPESLADPGATVQTSLTGLESGTTISARGGCADTSPAGGHVLGEFETIVVP